jgi:hypothetical protein
LKAAAVCERLEVIDQLIAAQLPVDTNPDTGLSDGGRTVLSEIARFGEQLTAGHREVEAILQPLSEEL